MLLKRIQPNSIEILQLISFWNTHKNHPPLRARVVCGPEASTAPVVEPAPGKATAIHASADTDFPRQGGQPTQKNAMQSSAEHLPAPATDTRLEMAMAALDAESVF